MVDLAKLLELAKKATQETWHHVQEDDYAGDYIMSTTGDICDLYFMSKMQDTPKNLKHNNSKANAQYIAALSPDKMIPFIERYLELEKKSMQRGARMQIMKQEIEKRDWWGFSNKVSADDWFDDDGVPL